MNQRDHLGRIIRVGLAIVLISLILAGCSVAAPTATVAPAATVAPSPPTATTAPIAPTATVAPAEPTATVAPAEPTATIASAPPTATAAPAAPTETAAPVAPTATVALADPTETAAPTGSAVTGEVVVFAASSLTDAFTEIGQAFQEQNPGTTVTFNFGASSQLRTQLVEGAPADVFASADTKQMDEAAAADLLAGEAQVFVRNRLVLIVPVDNPAGIESVKDLAKPGIKFVTTNPEVPIGRYTQQVLDRASADPDYGADFGALVEANIVSREENVRQVVAKVQLGEADAGICYVSDVTPAVRDAVTAIEIPDELNQLATYPIAPLAGAANPAAGEAFMAFVQSEDGQRILTEWGFLSAEP